MREAQAEKAGAILRLGVAGQNRRDVEEERSLRVKLLRRYVREAADAGIPKTRIAEVAGVSRQTVHEMLREDNR